MAGKPCPRHLARATHSLLLHTRCFLSTVSVGETYVCLSFWGSQSSSPQTATTASTFTTGQRPGFQTPSVNQKMKLSGGLTHMGTAASRGPARGRQGSPRERKGVFDHRANCHSCISQYRESDIWQLSQFVNTVNAGLDSAVYSQFSTSLARSFLLCVALRRPKLSYVEHFPLTVWAHFSLSHSWEVYRTKSWKHI